jgi:mRNA interferase RelE/StbE
MYKVLLTQKALKDLDLLEKQEQHRIIKKLNEYANEPLKHSRKLTTPKIGTYRFRIGDYRVIFDIDEENIVILRIGHRKSIYI